MNWLPWMLFLFVSCIFIGVQILVALQGSKRKEQRKAEQKELTELRQALSNAQRERNHAEDIVNLIQEHMVEGILILDDSDKIQLVNRTAGKLLHLKKDDWDTKSIFILTDNQAFLSALRKSKIKQQSQVRETLKMEEKYIRTRINCIEMGGIYGTIILLVDVTYSVKAEKIRQEFTANVSHELKTPLTIIKGFGEMFSSGMIIQEEDVQKYGAMIERESERLLFLINDIIRLSEIEEHTDLLNTQVDLARSVKTALQILDPVIQRNDIHVTLEGDALLLRSNESYIQELFVNLIDNAIKYNNPGGKVNINISRNEKQAKIVVSDNGIGIPLHAQSRIFERFYRVDKSRSQQRGGTGLGLSIVKHIVDYHNGTISLRSELGHGTEITILLPL
ncbi:MAG: ATP-binding protein [Ruminococcus sp.]|nr:ATP-binding protein [Ruminococcus sp.]